MPEPSLLTRVRELAVLIPQQRSVTRAHRTPAWRRQPQPPPDADQRWRSRPMLAGAVKAAIVLIPAAASIAVVALLNWGMPSPGSWPLRIGWWVLLLAVSSVVAIAVERQSRRLLPLAVLLRLTLLFPDEAPSRFKIARAAVNPQRLRALAADERNPRSGAATQVLGWVAQLSRHDRHTRGHSERVRIFADLIAEQLDITGLDRDKLRWASLLHDVGKLHVPAAVLNKPGKPTPNEWDVLRRHPKVGLDLVGPLAEWLGPWAGGIGDHHERFDGSGYPAGLRGREISLAGRVVAVADSYETMTAARSYKLPMAAADGRAELTRCAGTHFDPDIVRAFLAVGLPRLLYSIGPVSFLLHLPFLSRMPEVGLTLVSAAGQAAAPVAAGLTAASVATAGVVSPVATGGSHGASGPAAHGSVAATTAHRGAFGSLGDLTSATGSVVRLLRSARSGDSGTAGSGTAGSKPGASTPAGSKPGAPTPSGSAPTASAPTTSTPGASAPTASTPGASAPIASTPTASTSESTPTATGSTTGSGSTGGQGKGSTGGQNNGNAYGRDNAPGRTKSAGSTDTSGTSNGSVSGKSGSSSSGKSAGVSASSGT